MREQFDPENPTSEQIEKHYSAAMDSVNLINSLVTKGNLLQDEIDTVSRNVRHLQIMVAKTWWTNQNLTPLTDAITAGNAVLP